MKIKIKKLHELAKVPTYSHLADAGADLYCTSKEFDKTTNTLVFGTGLAFEIPESHVGLIFPRSSIYKTPLSLANNIAVIDSGFLGEVTLRFRIMDRPRQNYEIGDRIGQLIVLPIDRLEFEVVEELSNSDRGLDGFGSSGR